MPQPGLALGCIPTPCSTSSQQSATSSQRLAVSDQQSATRCVCVCVCVCASALSKKRAVCFRRRSTYALVCYLTTTTGSHNNWCLGDCKQHYGYYSRVRSLTHSLARSLTVSVLALVTLKRFLVKAALRRTVTHTVQRVRAVGRSRYALHCYATLRYQLVARPS